MKNTILLLLLLTAPCFAFGQSATTDSTVTIPKRWFRKASADLMRLDDCRTEIGLLRPQLAASGKLVDLLARDTTAKAEYIGFLKAEIQSEKLLSASLEANCNASLQRYASEAKKAKRRSRLEAVLIGIAAGATGYFVHSLVR